MFKWLCSQSIWCSIYWFRIATRVMNLSTVPKITINRLIIIRSIFIQWMNRFWNGAHCYTTSTFSIWLYKFDWLELCNTCKKKTEAFGNGPTVHSICKHPHLHTLSHTHTHSLCQGKWMYSKNKKNTQPWPTVVLPSVPKTLSNRHHLPLCLLETFWKTKSNWD